MNLLELDIKLLVVLDAVMREKSVTKAGQFLGMSQPSISNALKKLRVLLDDEVFVRVPGGVVPTPRAQELAVPLREALLQLQSAFAPTQFIPSTAEYTFHFAISETCAILVLPELHKRIRSQAPKIRLVAQPKRDHLYISQLESNEIHVDLGIMTYLPNRIDRTLLFRDHYVCVMRKSHPLAGKAITADEYFAADHLAIKATGDAAGIRDSLLTGTGFERNVATYINQSILAPLLIRTSDLILTTSARVVSQVVDYCDFYVSALPFEVRPTDSYIAWTRSFDRHSIHAWMHKQIIDVCSTLFPLERGAST